jgi:DNA-binding beta-propeller fold protein YncE
VDQLVVDGRRKRLFAVTLGERQITAAVIDLKSNIVIPASAAPDKAQGAFYSAEFKKLLVAHGTGETYDVFNWADFNLVDGVSTGTDTKHITYDPLTKYLYVGAGDAQSGSLSVLDSKTNRLTREIRTDAQPGEIVSAKTRPRIFVTFKGTSKLGVVDRRKYKQVATWFVPGVRTNAALALDQKHHRLFVGSRIPSVLTVLDSDSGQTISQLEGVEGIRGLWYDAARQRVYASGVSVADEGFVFAYQQRDRDHYELTGKMLTVSGAGACLWVPEFGRLYVAARANEIESSRILVFEPLS